MSRTNPGSYTTRNFPFLAFAGLLIILNLSTQTQTHTQTKTQDKSHTNNQTRGPVVLTDFEDEYPLGLHLEIFKDPTRQLTIEEVASPEFDEKFIRNKKKVLNPGFVNSTYWIRFQVNSKALQTGEWWLEIAGFEIDASLYYPRSDGRPGFEVKRAGWTSPTAEDKITYHYYPAFHLPLPPGSNQTIYLRVSGQRLNLPLTLWSGAGFIRESQKDFVFNGLYLGILLVMAVYNLFLFFALRDESHLYYVLFMMCALFAVFLRMIQIHLFHNNLITIAVATLMVVFLLRFSVSFLMAKVHVPRLGRILAGLQIGVGATGLLYIVSSRAMLFNLIWFVLVMFGLAVIFTTSLVTLKRGYRPARYFVLAQTILLGSFFLSLLSLVGYAPLIFAEYTNKIGVSLMSVLMSLALADRINTIRKERELAEAQTRQRNRELTLLNQVIAASTTAVDLETVLETVCRELGRAFNLTHAIAVIAEKKKQVIRIVADFYSEDRPSIMGKTFPINDNPILGHISVKKEPLIVKDVQNDPRTTSIAQYFHMENATSLILFPLAVEKEIIGGFILGSNNPGHFSADELSLMQSVGEQIAGTIIRIRLAEDRQQLEAQYYQSRKMNAIGGLAGGIAHDFNNLLTPITGYMEMAMADLSHDHEIYPYLDKVLKAAGDAAKLTMQILAFSRKQVLKIKSVNLNNIITDFNNMLFRLIGEDIELQLALDSSLNPVRVDHSQIEQVLLNLVLNARDAMPLGGKLIIETSNVSLDEKYAESHAVVIPGPYVMLSVSDNGCGMDDETKRRIYEPFFTTKEQGKGTGLGLSTVYGIVKQHNGNILVYSEPDKGTTFKIYLPQAADEPVQTESPKPTQNSQGGIETVLVVEDEEGVRELVCETLEKYGYRVLRAEGPKQGINIASTHSTGIDLLLTDVIMPEMNGRELYRQLHAISPGTKVLYMSGYTDNMIVRDGILKEGTKYLQKPFSIKKLTQKVRNVLDE